MSFDIDKFEDSVKQNGICYWDARDFMDSLGYTSWESFLSVIRKSMASCARADLMPDDNFIKNDFIDESGKTIPNYKLTRFACLLITMHADDKKSSVAKAKVALAKVVDYVAAISENDLGRLEVRNDLKAAEQQMSDAAFLAGVEGSKFGIFKDAGFRGMYNMSSKALKELKGIPDKVTPYNVMGLTELAGNLFRVTQTAQRIQSSNVSGLNSVAKVATDVGKEVRDMMIKNSGVAPEELPIEQNIDDVKKGIKNVEKTFKKIDKPKK